MVISGLRKNPFLCPLRAVIRWMNSAFHGGVRSTVNLVATNLIVTKFEQQPVTVPLELILLKVKYGIGLVAYREPTSDKWAYLEL